MPAMRWCPKITYSEFWYDSCGAGQIHGCRWEPDTKPRCIIQIVHGITDHAERYNDFAAYMSKKGFLVIAEDHMGHGKSGGDKTVRGYFNGGWFAAVEDTFNLLKAVRNEYPETPCILLGHSMGSFMAMTLLQKYPEHGLAGCILCGTGWQPDAGVSAGIKLCDLICRKKGEKAPSPRLQTMLFGAYNMNVEHPRTDYDWVNRKSREVDEYLSDPLCRDPVTAGLMRDLLIGISYIQTPENMARIQKDIPIMVIAGGDDPVGAYGHGTRKTVQELKERGMQNVFMRIYPLCRHEILHEMNKFEIYENIFDWIERL